MRVKGYNFFFQLYSYCPKVFYLFFFVFIICFPPKGQPQKNNGTQKNVDAANLISRSVASLIHENFPPKNFMYACTIDSSLFYYYYYYYYCTCTEMNFNPMIQAQDVMGNLNTTFLEDSILFLSLSAEDIPIEGVIQFNFLFENGTTGT